MTTKTPTPACRTPRVTPLRTTPTKKPASTPTDGPFVPAEGPAAPAGTDAGSAVEVKADHKAYRVALSAAQQGWIRYSADELGELTVFVSQDVALDAVGDQNPQQTIPIEDKSTVDACTEVAARHTLDIDMVGTVYLLLGGGATESGPVTLVVEHGGHHHDHGT